MNRLIATAVAVLLTACPPPPAKPLEWQTLATGLDEALMGVDGTSDKDVWAVGADQGLGPLGGRLGVEAADLFLLPETNLQAIIAEIVEIRAVKKYAHAKARGELRQF